MDKVNVSELLIILHFVPKAYHTESGEVNKSCLTEIHEKNAQERRKYGGKRVT
jgi:hypothetical protein